MSAPADDSAPPSDGGDSELEDDGVSLLWRFLPVQLEVLNIAPAFGGSEGAREALVDLGRVLREVSVFENEHLENMVYNLSQFLVMLGARPSQENGNQLRSYTQLVRESLDLRRRWPMEPLPDSRMHSILADTEHFMFEHETEGLIRLQWVNPLPLPAWMSGGGFQCDVCMDPDLRAGYQHVTEDNERDSSSFFVHRIGYDVCASCAIKHVESRRDALLAFVSGVAQGETRELRRPCAEAAGAPPALQLASCNFSASSGDAGGLSVELEVCGTGGWHVAAALLPTVNDAGDVQALPSSWRTTGRALPAQSPGAASAPEAASSQPSAVALQCASGCSLRITAASVRGALLLARAEGEAEPAVFRAVMLGERALEGSEETLPFLSFQGVAKGVWIRAEDKCAVLSNLRSMASRVGVAHNIPPQVPEEAPARRVRAVSTVSSAMDVSETTAEGSGCAAGYLLPPDWAELNDCMICLDALGEATWLRGAPLSTRCGHLFHAMCLRKHLRSSSDKKSGLVCPNCRAEEPLRDASPLGGSGSLRWTLARDSEGSPLESARSYKVTIILCQDPQAVADSALVVACTARRAE